MNCGEVLREWLRGKLPGKTLFSCSSYTNKQSIPARLANHAGDSTKNKQTLTQINPSIARKELLKSFTDSVRTKSWPWHVFYGIHKEHKLHFFGRVHIVVIKILNKETIRSVSSKTDSSLRLSKRAKSYLEPFLWLPLNLKLTTRHYFGKIEKHKMQQ